MLFDKIKGHDSVLQKLSTMCEDKSFSGVFIFKGPPSIGKHTTAKTLTKYLTCTESEISTDCRCSNCRQYPSVPDLFEVDKGTDLIKIEDIAALEEYASLLPYKSKRKVVLINNIENLNNHAANRLLKLLEVPREHIVYIFISSNFKKISPIIVSRCRTIEFEGLTLDAFKNILSNQKVSDRDTEFLWSIHDQTRSGVLGRHFVYLKVEKTVPSFVKQFTGKNENNLLIQIDELVTKGELTEFLEILIVYVGDILKMHFGCTNLICFRHDLENIEGLTEKWTEDLCLALISKLRECLKIGDSGLNLSLRSNVRNSVSWIYMLLNKKSTTDAK